MKTSNDSSSDGFVGRVEKVNETVAETSQTAKPVEESQRITRATANDKKQTSPKTKVKEPAIITRENHIIGDTNIEYKSMVHSRFEYIH